MELVIGQRHTGKTTLLKRWFLDDVHEGRGAVFLAFDDSTIDDLLSHIPPERQPDVALLDASDRDHVTGFNIFERVAFDDRPLVALSVVSTLKSVTGYTGNTPVLDRVLYNASRLCMDNDETFLGLFYLLFKEKYRKSLVKYCTDPTVKDFWYEFGKLPPKEQRDMTASTLSNVEPFITDITIRNIIGQTTGMSFKDIENKIVLLKLPKQFLGYERARLLGLLLLTSLFVHRPITNLYIDDGEIVDSPILWRFTDLDMSTNVSFRSASCPLDLADRIVSFRLGIEDSKKLKRTFLLGDNAIQLHQLEPFEGYILNGIKRGSFSLEELDYPTFPTEGVVNRCRDDYTQPREKVEKKIRRFLEGLR